MISKLSAIGREYKIPTFLNIFMLFYCGLPNDNNCSWIELYGTYLTVRNFFFFVYLCIFFYSWHGDFTFLPTLTFIVHILCNSREFMFMPFIPYQADPISVFQAASFLPLKASMAAFVAHRNQWKESLDSSKLMTA